MNLKTIINKINDGVKLILTAPSLLFMDVTNPQFYMGDHLVTEFDEGRPDLIALKWHGTADTMDLILKYNGISDPFSIKKGDIIEIPSVDIPIKKYNRPSEVSEDIVKQKFIDTKRLTKPDQKRIAALKKKYNKENLLPPNVIPVGKKTYKIERGNITFGVQAQSDPVVDKIEKESRLNKVIDKTNRNDAQQ